MSEQKTIGVIGGTSWHSSATYYRHLNEIAHERLGRKHSARVLLDSIDFDEIDRLQVQARWNDVGAILAWHASRLEDAGADLVLVAANAMHTAADAIESAITVPFIHIADAIAHECRVMEYEKVGLIGTRYTMSMSFLVDALRDRGITAIQAPQTEHAEIDRVIYDELTHGIFRDTAEHLLTSVTEDLVTKGSEAVVLACSELAALAARMDVTSAAYIDTAYAHCRMAIDRSLSD
ncbi:MAG: racemase [Thermoleophilia bacterium]|nr:racemase [Thermoleophilia bacterium]